MRAAGVGVGSDGGDRVMDERRDLVDREELRRQIKKHTSVGHYSTTWNGALVNALNELDRMPAVECPRGWTRDEVLAELDADPDAVCDYLHPYSNEWMRLTRLNVEDWHPEVRRYDVRVVRVAPEPEWVPLTQLVGRTIDGCDRPVEKQLWFNEHGRPSGWWWYGAHWLPVPEGTLNLETGQVAVRPKAAT